MVKCDCDEDLENLHTNTNRAIYCRRFRKSIGIFLIITGILTIGTGIAFFIIDSRLDDNASHSESKNYFIDSMVLVCGIIEMICGFSYYYDKELCCCES